MTANHRNIKYYRIAEITIQLEADLPISQTTFLPKYNLFQVSSSGTDVIQIRHHFSIPQIGPKKSGEKIYHKAPWEIAKTKSGWIYTGFFCFHPTWKNL